jgi:nickel/cobalt exporter
LLQKRPVEGRARIGSAKQLLVLGITGGIVPCPAALVVLLSALALHRVVFGLLLIVSFSVGLAVVLIGLGMIAVYAGRMMVRLRTEGVLVQRWLPLTSSAMIAIIGCLITIRGLMAAGIVQFRI